MSSSSSRSSADDSANSRREKAARAAERRIQKNARAIAAGATITSGKRRAPGASSTQVHFSDSDDSDRVAGKGSRASGEGNKGDSGGAKKRGRREEMTSGKMVSFYLPDIGAQL